MPFQLAASFSAVVCGLLFFFVGAALLYLLWMSFQPAASFLLWISLTVVDDFSHHLSSSLPPPFFVYC
jgi:hypothetical protein